MKKFTKLFSVALAAAMTLGASANAMTFNAPMEYDMDLTTLTQSYANCANTSSTGKWYGYIAGSPTLTMKTENSYIEGKEYKEIDTGTGTYNIYKLFGGSDTACNVSKNYVGSYGPTEFEIIFKHNVMGTSTDYNSLQLDLVGIDTAGKENSIGISRGWSDGSGFMYINADGQKVEEGWFGRLDKDTWYRLKLSVNPDDDTCEVYITKFDDGNEVDVLHKVNDLKVDLKTVNTAWIRFPAGIFCIGKCTMTRTGTVLKDLTVSDTSDVTATVKAANNNPANDCFDNYLYLAPWDTTTPTAYTNAGSNSYYTTHWTNVGANALAKDRKVAREVSPRIFLCQYNENGKLLAINSNTLESFPTLQWGTNKPSEGLKENDGFEFQNLTVTAPKADGYSYAKAFVWDSLAGQVPYSAAVSTQVEAAE